MIMIMIMIIIIIIIIVIIIIIIIISFRVACFVAQSFTGMGFLGAPC